MLGVIIEISLSFYTLDLVIVAFLLSRDFPLFQGLALTLPPILATEVPLSPTSTIGAYQGTFALLKNGGERELLMKETDAFQIRRKGFQRAAPLMTLIRTRAAITWLLQGSWCTWQIYSIFTAPCLLTWRAKFCNVGWRHAYLPSSRIRHLCGAVRS